MYSCAVILLLVLLCNAFLCHAESAGTTAHLRDIFVGRCWSYVEINPPNEGIVGEKDCEEIWDHFLSAFAYRDPCSPTTADYEAFVSTSAINIPQNQTMFWSGTYAVAHEYASANKQYFTLEDTLLGYIMNGLTWCGQSDSPGVNYESCPLPQKCGEHASTSFWAAASNSFASGARGEVTVVLNGSNPQKPAFNKNSYFGKHELMALNTEKVTMVTALVIHSVEQTYRESCNNGSLPALQEAVTSRGLKFRCIDDPTDIFHLLCVRDPHCRECQLVHRLHHPNRPTVIGR